jgi:hypothetical protein
MGCSLPGPRNTSLSNPRKLSLCEFVEFLVQQRDAQLHDTVCSHATPALMLAPAHSAANYSVDRRFDEAGRDSPSYTLPRAIVDQRLKVDLEISDHIREVVARFLDFAAHGRISFLTQIKPMTIMQATLHAVDHTGSTRCAKTFDLLDNKLLLHTIEL